MTVYRKSAKQEDIADSLTDELLDESTGTEEAPADLVFDDSHIAELLAAEAFADTFRHARGIGWLRWDGTRWCENAQKDAYDTARLWAVGKFGMAADTWKAAVSARRDAVQAEAIMKGWKLYNSKARQDAIVVMASRTHGVTAEPGEFDSHPDLINTQNGVVDLRTGELQPHDPKLLLTKITRAAYVPGATHADWNQALEAVPEDTRNWYQARLGQAITGHMTPDDVMLVQQGGGENGKSTLMGAIEQALGGYYLTVPHRALLGDNRQHDTEITTFRGARFAVLEELPEGRHLNVTRLKATVGTSTMTARRIAQDNITWEATHSLLVNTNYPPGVDETDHGTWRRLILVKFPFRFVGGDGELQHEDDRPGDGGLRQRLRLAGDGQADAVLAWLVAGAARCYSEDGRVQEMPPLPGRVIEDTRAWRADSDVVYQYLTEELVADAESYILTEDLYDDIREWLQSRGHKQWANKTVVYRIENHDVARELGMYKDRKRAGPGRSYRANEFGESRPTPDRFNAWIGVRFASASDQPEPDSGMGGMAHCDDPKKTASRRVVTNTHPTHPTRGSR